MNPKSHCIKRHNLSRSFFLLNYFKNLKKIQAFPYWRDIEKSQTFSPLTPISSKQFLPVHEYSSMYAWYILMCVHVLYMLFCVYDVSWELFKIQEILGLCQRVVLWEISQSTCIDSELLLKQNLQFRYILYIDIKLIFPVCLSSSLFLMSPCY